MSKFKMIFTVIDVLVDSNMIDVHWNGNIYSYSTLYTIFHLSIFSGSSVYEQFVKDFVLFLYGVNFVEFHLFTVFQLQDHTVRVFYFFKVIFFLSSTQDFYMTYLQ